jgi:Flp pilus assembly protein TadD
MRSRVLLSLLLAATLFAGEDPFETPQELKDFATRQTSNLVDSRGKLDHLVKGFFAPTEEGGLGMTYDNSYTRTVREGYRDRKANCFTLTAMYISCCRSVGVEAQYARSLRLSHWRRDGDVIRNERHMVAMVPEGPPGHARVADFLPEVAQGIHHLMPITDQRALALFRSNRAIELMGSARAAEALATAKASVEGDPLHGGGWNVLGVLQRELGLVKEAEASFRRAMAMDAADGIPCGNLEILLRAQGRDREAQACREMALESRKRDPYFNAFLAQEALAESRWKEAEKRVAMALEILPHEPEFFLLQARINLAQGQARAAVKALEQARKWAVPDDQPRWNAKLTLLKGSQGDH